MKKCKICKEPKIYHTKYYISHEFELDNLDYLERIALAADKKRKHEALNFCNLCKSKKKSPFGICKECSYKIILNRATVL